MSVTVWTFIIVLTLITLSGTLSILHKKKTPEDYLIASQGVKPWLSALSAVATNNSGFMFVGMIAYTYRQGIDAIWMMFGWVLGDLTVWLLVHSKVRRMAEKSGLNTLSQLIGTKQDRANTVVIAAVGVITFTFLAVYAAGQLKAGSTALHTLFEWDMSVGVLIGTGIVILYSFAGGIRADIWTDAAQSFVMMISMGMILAAGYREIGGFDTLMANLGAQDPALVHLFPEELEFGILAYILGFTFAGVGTIGQPHLMVRYMAIESVQAIKRAGVYYFLWYVPFFLLSIGVGLYSRALMPFLTQHPLAQGMAEPTELALPLITMELLPQVFGGIALAGLFAATISTADSQIIVCSGALTHDISPRWKHSYLASKVGTFLVTTLAVGTALFAPEGVFGLVLIAWSAMGASLGPLLVLRVFQKEVSTPTALTMIVAAVATVIGWHQSQWNDDVFKILPGFVAAFAVYGVAWLWRQRMKLKTVK